MTNNDIVSESIFYDNNLKQLYESFQMILFAKQIGKRRHITRKLDCVCNRKPRYKAIDIIQFYSHENIIGVGILNTVNCTSTV